MPAKAFDREQAVEAAFEVLDEEGGLEGLTMRAVARKLGTGAMTVYNHFASKDDLLNAMSDAVLGEISLAGTLRDDWRSAIEELSLSVRETVLARAAIIPELTQRGRLTEVGLRLSEAYLSTLQRAGLSPQDSARAYRALSSYVDGHLIFESMHFFDVDDEEALARTASNLALPAVQAAFPHVLSWDVEAEFVSGLRMLLDGIAKSLPVASAAPKRRARTAVAS
jgi:AcrR family transcriptional regulator